MAIETRVILETDGRFYQEKTSKSLIDVDNAMIQSIISGFSVMIDNIIDGWSTLTKSSGYTMFCNLTEFNLKTHFTPDGDGAIIPTFADTGHTIDWCPAVRVKDFSHCHFWFGIDMRRTAFNRAYFVWRDTITGKVCVPPLGNVYDDGKFCMGHDVAPTVDHLLANGIVSANDGELMQHVVAHQGGQGVPVLGFRQILGLLRQVLQSQMGKGIRVSRCGRIKGDASAGVLNLGGQFGC